MAQRHPLVTFFTLTFVIAWGVPGGLLGLAALTGAFEVDFSEFAPLTYVAVWSPAIAAFAVVARLGGAAALRSFARRLVAPSGHWGWYALVLLGVPSLTFTAAALTHVSGTPSIAWPTAEMWLAFVPLALAKATLGPVEELGWRGFALPRLQQRYSGLVAALILGAVWALWHVPALFMESIMTGAFESGAALNVVRLFIGIMAKSVVMTALFNVSGGSVPLMVLYHWLGNLPYPWELDHGVFVLQDVFDVVLAVVLVATLRGRRGSPLA